MPASPSFIERRRCLVVVAASLLVSSLLGGSVATVAVAAAGTPDVAAAATTRLEAGGVPTLRWASCGGRVAEFQCATAQVPLDYDHPGGDTISLALTRLPATDRAGRIGSLFVNPGGPGGSGVRFVQALGNELFTAEVRARFDLIGFDPRGVAGSTPLQCFDTTDDALEALAPMWFPYTRKEERIWIRADRAYAKACDLRGGPIIDHMSTANVARDMDLLRQAVGDEQMTFVGYSYGSYIGSTYANMFPDEVRAVVIDGVIDPVSYATGRGDEAERLPIDARLVSEQGAQKTFRGFLSLCDKGGERCAFSAGDPKKRYDRLARRLLDEPAELPDGNGGLMTFTYQDLVATTLDAMYDASSWPDFATFLAQLDSLAEPERAAAALMKLDERFDPHGDPPYSQVLEGYAGVWCSDGDNPDTTSAWAKAARAADRKYRYFGRLWNWGGSICASWPGKDSDRYTGPFTKRTANHILVVGTRSDPATRYEDAVSTEKLLRRARLLTVEGWGHTSLFISSCADRHVSHYLLTGDVPPKHVRCTVDVVPFAEGASVARATASSPWAFFLPTTVRPKR
jgi:pimeloyl-ACP methyl ester carboxylesterase